MYFYNKIKFHIILLLLFLFQMSNLCKILIYKLMHWVSEVPNLKCWLSEVVYLSEVHNLMFWLSEVPNLMHWISEVVFKWMTFANRFFVVSSQQLVKFRLLFILRQYLQTVVVVTNILLVYAKHWQQHVKQVTYKHIISL